MRWHVVRAPRMIGNARVRTHGPGPGQESRPRVGSAPRTPSFISLENVLAHRGIGFLVIDVALHDLTAGGRAGRSGQQNGNKEEDGSFHGPNASRNPPSGQAPVIPPSPSRRSRACAPRGDVRRGKAPATFRGEAGPCQRARLPNSPSASSEGARAYRPAPRRYG